MQTQKVTRTKAQTRSSKSTRRRRKELQPEPVILDSPPVASPPTVVVPAAPTPEVSPSQPVHAQPVHSTAPQVAPADLDRVESTGEELFEPGHWLKLLGQWTEETVFKMLFHRRTP